MAKVNVGKQLRENWHLVAVLLMLYDIVAVNAAYLLALFLRFDCAFSAIPLQYLAWCMHFLPFYSVICLLVFLWQRLYNSVWRYASITELLHVIAATVVTTLVHTVGISAFFGRMPVSYYLGGACIQFLLMVGVRFSYRFVLLLRDQRVEDTQARVMMIGAGSAGQMILKSTQEMKNPGMRIVCFIDDNPNKWGRRILDVPVVGGRDSILENVKKYRVDKIFIALPSAARKSRREVLNICKETGCELKNLPDIAQIVDGRVSLSDMQDVAVEDLLGRDTINVDMEQICNYVSGKTILVTGGGGSIGSELCRQVAAHAPKLLIVFDIYENSAYAIEQELRRRYPDLPLLVRIGSVRDSRCLESVFSMYRPDVVYHAAAHKHVPLMESSPCEAIKNNVIGTYKTAYAAIQHNCRRFVLISTDKAVNPTSIMGASKRLCEMVIQSFDRAVRTGTTDQLPSLYTHDAFDAPSEAIPKNAHTEFVAVRFGNVLGSNGSVIPLFKKQIREGGPVTVTHPDVVRYFMTIPEAVSLVMQAGAYADGGHIYVLDMGTPMRIVDLAKNLIKLSGLHPGEDIKIVYTGLRPGEKLYEEKLMAEEGLRKTANELIHIGNPIPLDTEKFLVQLRKLMEAAYENDPAIRDLVAEMVPTYHPEDGQIGDKDETYKSLCESFV